MLMAFRWGADDGPTLNTDLVALSFSRGSGLVLLRNPTALSDFPGEGVFTPCPPPFWSAHVMVAMRCMAFIIVFQWRTEKVLNNPAEEGFFLIFIFLPEISA